ncbi:MAG: hypothetical protein JW836_08125 [Deltaproteobacteria bacterium]|nr:hypothetical protein [Deltaproteobacteria bacterium]
MDKTGIKQRKPAIRIHKIPIMSDYWGRRFKRPLRSELLQETIRRYFSNPDNALLSSIEKLQRRNYGLKDLRTVTAGLFQEGEYAYVFRVHVETADGRKSWFAMIIAKNEGPMSRAAKLEHENLKRLRERCKNIVAQSLEGGPMTLLGTGPTSVYTYFTVWLHRFHELGVQHKTMNFYINELPFQYFDSRLTDAIKARMLALMFRLYDPLRREAIEPPRVGAGDFVITRKGPHELKLVACRRILKGVSLDRCIARYLGYYGSWGSRLFHFVPDDTALLRRALIEGLVVSHGYGAEQVFLALKRYRDSLAGLKAHQEEWTPLPTLNKLLSQGLA